MTHLTRSSSKGDLDLDRNNAGSGRSGLTDGRSMLFIIYGVSAAPNGRPVCTWPGGAMVLCRRSIEIGNVMTYETGTSPRLFVSSDGRTPAKPGAVHWQFTSSTRSMSPSHLNRNTTAAEGQRPRQAGPSKSTRMIAPEVFTAVIPKRKSNPPHRARRVFMWAADATARSYLTIRKSTHATRVPLTRFSPSSHE
jgi:hypothetical protein